MFIQLLTEKKKIHEFVQNCLYTIQFWFLLFGPAVPVIANKYRLVHNGAIGTTRKPKVTEQTHSNHMSNILLVQAMMEDPTNFIQETDVSLVFLPLVQSATQLYYPTEVVYG